VIATVVPHANRSEDRGGHHGDHDPMTLAAASSEPTVYRDEIDQQIRENEAA
jgi:hypothetical protein